MSAAARARRTEFRDLDSITASDRHREDLGDVDALAASIEHLGLLHPVVVTGKGRLIAGERRLEAYRRLGRDTIEVRVAADLDTAAVLLEAERDENTCRLDMKPSEKVALGLALEELEKPKARERQGSRSDLTSGPRGPEHRVDGESLHRFGNAVVVGDEQDGAAD